MCSSFSSSCKQQWIYQHVTTIAQKDNQALGWTRQNSSIISKQKCNIINFAIVCDVAPGKSNMDGNLFNCHWLHIVQCLHRKYGLLSSIYQISPQNEHTVFSSCFARWMGRYKTHQNHIKQYLKKDFLSSFMKKTELIPKSDHALNRVLFDFEDVWHVTNVDIGMDEAIFLMPACLPAYLPAYLLTYLATYKYTRPPTINTFQLYQECLWGVCPVLCLSFLSYTSEMPPRVSLLLEPSSGSPPSRQMGACSGSVKCYSGVQKLPHFISVESIATTLVQLYSVH